MERGPAEVVIHNAPLGTRGPILDLSYQDLEKILGLTQLHY